MKTQIIFLLLIISSLAAAQNSNNDDLGLTNRVFFGGNFGLQFGTITNIEVSPLVGYRVTRDFSIGTGITYIYLKQQFDNFPDFETNIYGYRFFARHNIQQQFFAQLEYENLSLEFFNPIDGQSRREWVPGMLIGGGFFQPIGRNAGFVISAFYNLAHDDLRSPYNSPLILRVGITGGF